MAVATATTAAAASGTGATTTAAAATTVPATGPMTQHDPPYDNTDPIQREDFEREVNKERELREDQDLKGKIGPAEYIRIALRIGKNIGRTVDPQILSGPKGEWRRLSRLQSQKNVRKNRKNQTTQEEAQEATPRKKKPKKTHRGSNTPSVDEITNTNNSRAAGIPAAGVDFRNTNSDDTNNPTPSPTPTVPTVATVAAATTATAASGTGATTVAAAATATTTGAMTQHDPPYDNTDPIQKEDFERELNKEIDHRKDQNLNGQIGRAEYARIALRVGRKIGRTVDPQILPGQKGEWRRLSVLNSQKNVRDEKRKNPTIQKGKKKPTKHKGKMRRGGICGLDESDTNQVLSETAKRQRLDIENSSRPGSLDAFLKKEFEDWMRGPEGSDTEHFTKFKWKKKEKGCCSATCRLKHMEKFITHIGEMEKGYKVNKRAKKDWGIAFLNRDEVTCDPHKDNWKGWLYVMKGEKIVWFRKHSHGLKRYKLPNGQGVDDDRFEMDPFVCVGDETDQQREKRLIDDGSV